LTESFFVVLGSNPSTASGARLYFVQCTIVHVPYLSLTPSSPCRSGTRSFSSILVDKEGGRGEMKTTTKKVGLFKCVPCTNIPTFDSSRDGILKLLRSLEIDFKVSIPPCGPLRHPYYSSSVPLSFCTCSCCRALCVSSISSDSAPRVLGSI
jgi:hypothetical protein